MPSFDIVSKVAWHEVENALNQSLKEIGQRFDFKDTDTSLERNEEGISIRSSSEDRAKAAVKVLEEKFIRRKVSLKHVDQQKPEPTGKGGTRILLKIKEGIDIDRARKIVGLVKESKIKVQAQIQDNQVRISGKNRDDLQSAIHLMRQQDLGIELQFVNYRD